MSATVLTTDGIRAHVATPQDLLGFLGRSTVVAIDTETDGLGWDANVRTVQFGTDKEGYAVATHTEAGRALVRDAIAQYRGRLTAHNLPFDARRLAQLGVDLDYVWPRADNTMVMAHVLSPSEITYKLEHLAATWLGIEGARDQQKLLKERMRKHNLKRVKATTQWDWGTVPLLVLATYGLWDTTITHALHSFCESELTPAEVKVCQREYEAAQAVAEVSDKGFRLDMDYASHLQVSWGFKLGDYRNYFATLGVDNPNANRQWVEYLRGEGWVPEKFTAKAKEPQLDKPVLKELAKKYEAIQALLDYKRIAKWKAAYVDNCLEEAAKDGRVHALYKSLGARTGRMSCSQPPLQQLPKGGGGEVRSLFIASEGNVIASVDYSAIEMRLAGHFSKDQRVLSAYAEGRDIYSEMSEAMGCTRPQAKIAVLAALYGSKGKSIARALGCTADEAVAYVDRLWDQFPGLSRWSHAVEHKARSGNEVKSRWGRSLRPHAPYAAGNAIIQGTAAEVMKEGILRMAENGLLEFVVAIVHDEVVLDVPKRHAQELTDRVVATLEDHSFRVPLTCEGQVYGRSWGDGYNH